MRIEFLRLYTDKLQEQKKFYRDILQLPLREVSEQSFQVVLGFSILEFEERKSATPYHIAFHIPALQEEKALKWLKKRVTILENEGEEIVDFPAWDAKSVYFHDADKNVLEFISRKNFIKPGSSEFSEKSIEGISEIGLATGDVRTAFDFLHENFGLKKFTGDYEHFCATGDDEGLFIVIDKNGKDWFPSGDKAYASEFQIGFSTTSEKAKVIYKNERLELV